VTRGGQLRRTEFGPDTGNAAHRLHTQEVGGLLAARLRSAGVRLVSGLCLRADAGGHHMPGISGRSRDAASLARGGSSI